MSDLISRQAAIDALHMNLMYRMGTDSNKKRLDEWINSLPSAQPEPHHDEWCTDCKEYDHEKHCCPRWNKVIRQTLKEAQPEPLVAEIEEEYKRWVNVPHIRKPLAKALYEVWKKHDMEDAERRNDG